MVFEFEITSLKYLFAGVGNVFIVKVISILNTFPQSDGEGYMETLVAIENPQVRIQL